MKEKDIILFGYSLGGAVAVELASTDGAGGLILDRTFTSVPDVARSMTPILPVHWVMESKYDSLSKIRHYRGPLLQRHSDEDRVVPFELGQKLFEAANQPKEFVAMYDVGHNDPHDVEALRAMEFFFDEMDKSTIRCGFGMAGTKTPRMPGFYWMSRP